MVTESYRDLEVWQKAMDLVVECYRISETFPKEELDDLTSELRQAAVSVPTSIAKVMGCFIRRNTSIISRSLMAP